MKDIFKLLLVLFLRFIQNVGWATFGGLFAYIAFDFCKFAFGYAAEFHFYRAFFILGGLSLTLFVIYKLPVWLFKNAQEKIELREWR